jgi:hypothetical protein
MMHYRLSEANVMRTESLSSLYGDFHGELRVRLIEGGRVELLEDYVYVDPFGVEWVAPKGSVSEGASVPRWAWSMIDGAYAADYRNAAIIHDAACRAREHHWADVHRAFYHAMLAAGIPKLKAAVMYATVYHFGPRWDCAPAAGNESLHAEFAFVVNLLQQYELPLSHEAMASVHRRAAATVAGPAERRCA